MPVSPNDSLPISEFAALFGFPVDVIASAVEAQRYRVAKSQAFFSIPQLSERWSCSRATVYNILRENEVRVVDFTGSGKSKGKKLVPNDAVNRIEKNSTRKFR